MFTNIEKHSKAHSKAFVGRSVLALAGLIFCLSLGGCATSATQQSEAASQPNVLLIVVDDMGFADLGSFGSEIPTPNLDALAYSGVRLTNFITSPACSPTRAALLTGVDPHLSGFGNLKEELAPNQVDQPGHEGFLNQRVVTVATLLRDAGYRTYMTGKWHLGTEREAGPVVRGFDRSFAMLKNASHFADMLPAYSPDPEAKADYSEDGVLLDRLPEGFDYSSQFYVDRLIDYLESDTSSPFFAYLAFSAPHWPLQAPDAAIQQFEGAYAEGFDVVLERRLRQQKALGVVPANAEPSGRSPKGVAWSELDAEQRDVEARAMEIYAAMIAEMDRHTGRLIDYLKSRGELNNTAIIFLSDNGAEGHDYDDTWPRDAFPAIRKVIDERHDFSFANMGRPRSYTFYGPNWARVSAPTLRLYKAFPTEGGVRAAAFATMPGRFQAGAIENRLVLAKDLAPTILQLAGVEHPGDRYRGREIETMTGVSALSIFEGQAGELMPRVHADELIGKKGIRAGHWKLVHMPAPFGNGEWQLYDLSVDRSEQHDLAEKMPAKVQELSSLWQEYARDNGVILPNWVSGY